MKIAIRFAVALASIALSAASSTPPYDYFVSLYRWDPPSTLPDGRKLDRVIVYLGNNAFPGAAPEGQLFNVTMKAVNAAGQVVCSATDVQLPPIPTGKAWGAYDFQVIYAKPTPSPKPSPKLLSRRPPPSRIPLTTHYTITAMVSPEHQDGDRNLSNEQASQSFAFTEGGTPSCVTFPRPTFHQ